MMKKIALVTAATPLGGEFASALVQKQAGSATHFWAGSEATPSGFMQNERVDVEHGGKKKRLNKGKTEEKKVENKKKKVDEKAEKKHERMATTASPAPALTTSEPPTTLQPEAPQYAPEPEIQPEVPQYAPEPETPAPEVAVSQ
ncbi:unnamed protein product [Amoebophrya sp. A120]|nr:unnamed protein product [Amoebophrya sp. A120]|eukprot:GSA120T00023493001.1